MVDADDKSFRSESFALHSQTRCRCRGRRMIAIDTAQRILCTHLIQYLYSRRRGLEDACLLWDRERSSSIPPSGVYFYFSQTITFLLFFIFLPILLFFSILMYKSELFTDYFYSVYLLAHTCEYVYKMV